MEYKLVKFFCHCSTFLVYLGLLFFNKNFLRYLKKRLLNCKSKNIYEGVVRVDCQELDILISWINNPQRWNDLSRLNHRI